MNPEEYTVMHEAEDAHWWYVGLHELVLHSVREENAIRPRLRILDAGCGTGRLMQLMSRYGHVCGCDASSEALALCAARNIHTSTHADLNRDDIGTARYDLITSIDVISHRAILDDSQILRKLHAALTGRGLLILQAPAFEWLRGSHDIAVHTARRYRRSAVEAKLTEAGFQIVRSTYRVSLLFPFIAAARFLSRLRRGRRPAEAIPSDIKRHSGPVNHLLTAIMRAENRFIERHRWRFPFGASVFLVARKNRIISDGQQLESP